MRERPIQTLLRNLSWCTVVYNLVANSALYLFYELVPYSATLQEMNRALLWKFYGF